MTWNLCGSVCWKRGASGSQYPTRDFRGETTLRSAQVAAAVRSYGATVLLTQETCAGQYTAILHLLGAGWSGSFKSSNRSGNCKGGSTKVGLAIFTKGPQTHYRYTWLASDGVRAWYSLCVDWSGMPVCNVHIRAYVPSAEKARQAALTVAAVGGGRAILGGDFNQGPTGSGIRLARAAGFREVDERDNEPTSPGSVAKIDHIFVRGAAGVDGDSAPYLRGSISDHRLLRGYIRWH